MNRPVQRVGIAGIGAIGLGLARHLAAGSVPGLALGAIAGRDMTRTRSQAAEILPGLTVVAAAALGEHAEIVVDCAPSAALREIAVPALALGRTLVTVNAGALLSHLDLVDMARRTGGRILVPTGALLGLDAVRAAAEGRIERVTMVTRKPPRGLEGAPYLLENRISLAGLREPLLVFEGSAGDGAKAFPANVNVAAALSLAGIGPERTRLQVWADPALDRNRHTIEVEADSARFTMTIENIPSDENPRTGRITGLSVLACLRGLVETLHVGT
ncbi:MAG: aspartate dehydrogenase [Alphaproteobacteria bacterium]|nr:aspartate dehydrogenase [Alphaproteobacteria bacterium]